MGMRPGCGYKRGGGWPHGQREVLGPTTAKTAVSAEVEGLHGLVKFHGSALHPAARRATASHGGGQVGFGQVHGQIGQLHGQ